MTKLSKLVEEFKTIKTDTEVIGFSQIFDNKLLEIFQLGTPEIIGELLLCFNDDFEYYELMFSIIHTIETFSDDIYVDKIINNLEKFHQNSPEWASVIHTRIINSEPTFKAYKSVVKDASLKNKNALKALLNQMLSEEEDKGVEDKITQLLSFLN